MATHPPIPIGAFEAKTKFSELLRKVQQGQRFTITLHGKAVAAIATPDAFTPTQALRDDSIDAMINFPRVEGVDGDTVLEWIREGRE